MTASTGGETEDEIGLSTLYSFLGHRRASLDTVIAMADWAGCDVVLKRRAKT